MATDVKQLFFLGGGEYRSLFEKVPFISTLLSLIFYNAFENGGRITEIRKGET